VKTKRLFLFSMVLILLWGGLGCARNQPTATPASPTPETVVSGGTTVPVREGFMPPTADTPVPPPTPVATPAGGAAGPVITKLQYWDVYETFATLIWRTDVPTTGRVEYGHTEQYALSTPWTEGLTTVNGAILTGLDGFTTYWMRVRVKDAAGRETVSKGEPVFIYIDRVYQPWVNWLDLG
jgi:hypothetical protein